MTWFGIVVAIYWVLNLATNFFVIGRGGMEVTPGGAFLSIIVQGLLLWGLFAVGTGLM